MKTITTATTFILQGHDKLSTALRLLTATSFAVAIALLGSTSFAQSGDRAGAQTAPKAVASSSSSGSSTKQQGAGFVLFELFTSEGCSSCPPADRNLARITKAAEAAGQNVHTLSYHVDYWNDLGWQDPYSSSAASKRQRRYAATFEEGRVYTPQMVVNGVIEFNGSNQKNSDRAVQIGMQLTPKAALEISALSSGSSATTVTANWKVDGLDNSDRLRIALVQKEGTQSVTRGENARRKLSHVNIVRHLETVSAPAGEGSAKLPVPAAFTADEYHVVAFIQRGAEVVNVASAPIASP